MFQCRIQLVIPIKPEPGGEKSYNITVGKYDFNPGLRQGDEIYIILEVFGEIFELKAKVTGYRTQVIKSNNVLREYNVQESAKNSGLFLLIYFVEAEDRDKVVEIAKIYRNNNPQLQ